MLENARRLILAICLSSFQEIGALLEAEDRSKFSAELIRLGTQVERGEAWPGGASVVPDPTSLFPAMGTDESLFEYFVDSYSFEWQLWRPPKWEYPEQSDPNAQSQCSTRVPEATYLYAGVGHLLARTMGIL